MEGTMSISPGRRPGRRVNEGKAGFINTGIAVNNHMLIGTGNESHIIYNVR